MADAAHKWTDKQIAALERRVSAVYSQAQKQLQKEVTEYTKKFQKQDAEKRKKLEAGEITEDEYKRWLSGKVFTGRQWESKLSDITKTLYDANTVALGITNNTQYGVFAHNANYAAYEIEKGAKASYGFNLYDESTVRRLLRDDPDLLPQKEVDESADERWNQKKITQQITVGIIKGDSIDSIAKRISSVTGANARSSVLYARTAMTAAQNAGRLESYDRAKSMGIKLKKQWLATLDNRTRDTHRMLDGQTVEADKPFKVAGYEIMYPGDPMAEPEMTYNCRCTLIADIEDSPSENAQRYDQTEGKRIEDMTFSQWEKNKQEIQNKFTSQKENVIIDSQAYIHPDKIEKWCLKPGTKHYNEFADVGYSSGDYEQLDKDLKYGFSNAVAKDITYSEDGKYYDFAMYMNLGVSKKKSFRTVWRKEENSEPRFITAYRNEERK